MSKLKIIYICSECGYETVKWIGKCPNCNKFNTLIEDIVEIKRGQNKIIGNNKTLNSNVLTLKSIKEMKDERILTKIEELDRVLGGGIVEGSLTLVGGEPGIGKSTLILQICETIGNQNKKILYLSGEESKNQIKLRANRLKINTENLLLLCETNMEIIETNIKNLNPDLVIIDSIQTIYNQNISSAPGSITQIRECTSTFMNISKGLNIATIVIGHVTKDGTIAGPKILEHMVDTVLYFEGESKASYRIIRAVKNRFGSTNEVGVFEMREEGLVQILNPSEYMLAGRPLGVAGSVVTCTLEGTRPILTEVQALVSHTNFGVPRRIATGMDYNRVVMLIAVLEKRAGIQLGNFDSYVNIAGGMRIIEPSLDAAVIVSVSSSFKNKIVDVNSVVFGEVGLTGEMRAVSMAEKRIAEAEKLGFKKCFIPITNKEKLKKFSNIEVYGVSNVVELLSTILK